MAENSKKVLKEVTVDDLFLNDTHCTYEIPIYQRNYAWEDDEISALIQDVWDACEHKLPVYYVGTLVCYDRGDQRFEIIDGQQRLTTIRLILGVFADDKTVVRNPLTYTARKRSADTIKAVPDFSNLEDRDEGITHGFEVAKHEMETRDLINNKKYKDYWLHNVRLVRYTVPKDIDLNQYFEVMNSRGEQLEMHEIVKASLMQRLSTDEERRAFHLIWDACSNMSTYIQQNLDMKFNPDSVFGVDRWNFLPHSFEELLKIYRTGKEKKPDARKEEPRTILDILKSDDKEDEDTSDASQEKDTFQPIIDFLNFLLIVLKITRMPEDGFVPRDFQLDDKQLLNAFRPKEIDVRQFIFNLLKARFFLDNYVVHHSNEADTAESNPWKLQVWCKVSDKGNEKSRYGLRDLCGFDQDKDKAIQQELLMLLSMFEVSFTARQRKNYLFYSLLYLMQTGKGRPDPKGYLTFTRKLADKYFYDVYLDEDQLNDRNVPGPNSFDDVILDERNFSADLTDAGQNVAHKDAAVFTDVYDDGTAETKGIPLFVFNYMDYRIWKLYATVLRGEASKKDSPKRNQFFHEILGCSDFGLEIFQRFYFSRTRRSLEHYFPQANVGTYEDAPTKAQINCFGNFAMIGSDANSAGSNWSPKTKLDHYQDSSGKISRVSTASLKFYVMMQMCRDKAEQHEKDEKCWLYPEIQNHQEHMVKILMRECASSALRIQAGESPAPVKPSKQPVHSLEAKAAR